MADPTPQDTSRDARSVVAIGQVTVPTWLDALASVGWRVLVTIALFLVFGAIAVYLSIVTGAILVALIVAAMVGPVVNRLQVDRGWPRSRAAAAASVLAVVIVILVLILIVLGLIPAIAEIIRVAQEGRQELADSLTTSGAPADVVNTLDQAVSGLQGWVSNSVAELVEPIASFITILILGGFLTFYLLDDGDRAWAGATGKLDEWRARALQERATVAFTEVGGYLRGSGVLAATDALAAFVILTVLGVPLAGALSVLVFIGGFIPYAGGLATTVILVFATIATVGFGAAALLLVLLGVTWFVEERWIAPRAFGSGRRVNPGLALLAVSIGGALFGALGLFAAVPVLAAIFAFLPGILAALGTGPERPRSDSVVPVWLDRLAQFSWRALVAFALLYLVFTTLVLPILSVTVVLALILACVLKPIQKSLLARGLTPTIASLITTAASVAVVFLIVGITIRGLINSIPELVAELNLGASSLNLGTAPVDVTNAVSDGLSSVVATIVANIAGVFIGLGISLVLTFYLIRDGNGWWATVLPFVPAARRDGVNRIVMTSSNVLYNSMVATAVVSFAGAIMQFIVMVILGLPLAVPISVLMFFFGFIPYIGSFIATLLGFLVAVAVGTPVDIVLYIIWTLVFNIVQGNIVAPLVYSKTVSVHPAIVIVAAPAGAAIAGFVGMILIVPVIAMIEQTWRIAIGLFERTPTVPAADPAPAPSAVSSPAPAADSAASAPAGP